MATLVTGHLSEGGFPFFWLPWCHRKKLLVMLWLIPSFGLYPNFPLLATLSSL